MDETPFGVSVSNFKSHDMSVYRYIIYYQRDRDDWRDGHITANSLEEALSKCHYNFRSTPWTLKKVELVKDNELVVSA
jgi:hypothetical protein